MLAGDAGLVRHLVRAIEEFPAPVLAMVEGGVWGGACEVVLACDIIGRLIRFPYEIPVGTVAGVAGSAVFLYLLLGLLLVSIAAARPSF